MSRIALFEGVRRGLKRVRLEVPETSGHIALFEGVRRGLKRGDQRRVRRTLLIALFEGVRRGLKRPRANLFDMNASSPYSRE